MDLLNANSDGPWLVKSGEKILGPYSTEGLRQLIREKEVVVIDEVMSPQGRWTYLRDVPIFQSVVEEIRRGLMHSQENTEIQGHTSTPTSTKTEPILRTPSAESTAITQTATPMPSFARAAISVVTSTPSEDFAASSNTVDLGAALGPATRSVMTPRDRTKEKPPAEPVIEKRKVRPGMYVGSLVIIFALGYIVYTAIKKPATQNAAATTSAPAGEDLQRQASVAWKRGEFDRALELYRSIDRAQPGQPLIAARLATLMMKIEGQTVEAKRILESAAPSAKDPESQSALAIASGLAALQSDDAKEAIVKFEAGGDSWIASFDRGVAYASMKNWPDAIRAFEKAGHEPVSVLMLARTHLLAVEEGATNAQKATARQQAEAALKATANRPDFQQESLVLAAYNDLASNQTKRAGAKVLEAVETDPNQTGDHFHDPSLSLDQVSWGKFLPYCRSLHAGLASRASAALLGICLAKASQLEDATKMLEQELSREPSNTLLHAVNAYLQLLSGREDAARASLGLSVKCGHSRLAQILSARLCAREGQDACAEEGWAKLASEAKPPIAAITGLAQVRLAKGDSATANALMVKADSLSPSYLPLLRMREEASR